MTVTSRQEKAPAAGVEDYSFLLPLHAPSIEVAWSISRYELFTRGDSSPEEVGTGN